MAIQGPETGRPALSPYFFILLVDVLSGMLDKQVMGGHINGIQPKLGSPEYQHIFFADDSVFFMKGSVDKARLLQSTIKQYCHVSEQKVNFAKSSIFFNSGTEDIFKEEITEVFGVQHVSNPGFYLSVPTIWGRYRKEALNYLKEMN